ncbi:hypothetical protein P7E02_06365 [Enterococcus hulanensis]|uniref:hypothetical protein n=1 Tax=Enterococcus hulanensis TaxID=2559929 RepID=UPI00288E7D36|nr:hypothetical protein [Enterococcus hulanensis]MDT2659482.1 hypothetical protein [Enterococcus hulanensis]
MKKFSLFWNWIDNHMLNISIGSLSIGVVFVLIYKRWYINSEIDNNGLIPQSIIFVAGLGVSVGIMAIVQYLMAFTEKKGTFVLGTFILGVFSCFSSVLMVLKKPTMFLICFSAISIFLFSAFTVELLIPTFKKLQQDFTKKMELKDQLPIIVGLVTFLLGLLIGK